jgi:hypothetical protein
MYACEGPSVLYFLNPLKQSLANQYTMPAALSIKVMLSMAAASVIGISIVLIIGSGTDENGGNPLAALGADGKTIFLHQKPEANLMYNSTSHSYFNMQGKVFRCNSFFDGVIYYKANDTNYFKCIDRGSTQGENIQYQIVP